MEPIIENPNPAKQRHGCVTAWLVLMIVFNSLGVIFNILVSTPIADNLSGKVDDGMLLLLSILGFANIIFALMLLQWKKLGFWGFVISSIATLLINLYVGVGVAISLFGFAGILILWGVLQIRKNGETAWDELE